MNRTFFLIDPHKIQILLCYINYNKENKINKHFLFSFLLSWPSVNYYSRHLSMLLFLKIKILFILFNFFFFYISAKTKVFRTLSKTLNWHFLVKKKIYLKTALLSKTVYYRGCLKQMYVCRYGCTCTLHYYPYLKYQTINVNKKKKKMF